MYTIDKNIKFSVNPNRFSGTGLSVYYRVYNSCIIFVNYICQDFNFSM